MMTFPDEAKNYCRLFQARSKQSMMVSYQGELCIEVPQQQEDNTKSRMLHRGKYGEGIKATGKDRDVPMV